MVAGCLPTSVTEQGRVVNDLWNVFLVPAIAVAAVVWGLTTIAILRFRRRASTPLEPPPQIAGHTGLEVVWTVIPIAIVAVLFILTVGAVNRIYGRSDGGIDVNVTAFRWQWQIDYPGDGVTVVGLPEVPAVMVVPVGEPVHVTLTSPDVIHSFYVPIFLFKRDAVPGRTNTFEFTVEEAGTYGGQCAEFCGVNHDRMTFSVKAVPLAEYEAWLSEWRARTGTLGTSR
jgi:cytochrome c oxidase subunit 2